MPDKQIPNSNMLDEGLDYSLNIMFAKLDEQQKAQVRAQYNAKTKTRVLFVNFLAIGGGVAGLFWSVIIFIYLSMILGVVCFIASSINAGLLASQLPKQKTKEAQKLLLLYVKP